MRLLIALILLLMAVPVQAVDLTFGWTPNTDITEGYRLYESLGGDAALVTEITEREAATVTINQADEQDCHTYYLTAYAGALESAPSDTATWCPDSEIPGVVVRPGKPGAFMIIVTPVQ